jgi:hypothetical protein
VKQQNETQKFMLNVTWGINGFHVVYLMTGQHRDNSHYFFRHILERLLLAVFPNGRKPHSRRLSLLLDNCCVRNSKASENFFTESSFIPVPHPPYSPDLAPFDSGFWGT